MNKIYDLIIIGGGSAGLSAAIYAGRATLDTLIIERMQPGGQAAITSEIVNYPGIRKTTGSRFMEDMILHAQDFGATFLTSEITKLDFSQPIKKIYTENEVLECISVIIATGANPKKVGFPGEEEYTGRGVSYCSTCDGQFFKGYDIFVLGGGMSATEEALYLTRFGKSITMLVRKDRFSCPQYMAEKIFNHPKIKVKFNTEVVSVSGKQLLDTIVLKNNKTGEEYQYLATKESPALGLFVFAGYKPATDLFQNIVHLDSDGYIPTNEEMETNIKGIFAAGDLRPKQLRQIVTAVADGAIAATAAEKYISHYKEKNNSKSSILPDLLAMKNENEKKEDILTHKNQIQTALHGLQEDILLTAVLDKNKDHSKKLEDFVQKLSHLNSHIKVKLISSEESAAKQLLKMPGAPMLCLQGTTNKNLFYHGVPDGLELNNFLKVLCNLSQYHDSIDSAILHKINSITKKFTIKICVTTQCAYCPDTVFHAMTIGLLNSNITVQMVDISVFHQIQKEYDITSTPAIIVNDSHVYKGTKTVEELLKLLHD